jgi:hypothetical protein
LSIFWHFRYGVKLLLSVKVVASIPATHRSLSVAFVSVQDVCEPWTVRETLVVFKALIQMLAQQEIFCYLIVKKVTCAVCLLWSLFNQIVWLFSLLGVLYLRCLLKYSRLFLSWHHHNWLSGLTPLTIKITKVMVK